MSSPLPAPSEVAKRASAAATGASATSSADAAFTVRRVNAKVRPSGVARVRSGKAIDYSSRTDACRAATVACPAEAAAQRRRNARLGAVEIGQRGGGTLRWPARGMARITSSKIHARSSGGNRVRTDVPVVQRRSNDKFEPFGNLGGRRAAATILGATSYCPRRSEERRVGKEERSRW